MSFTNLRPTTECAFQSGRPPFDSEPELIFAFDDERELTAVQVPHPPRLPNHGDTPLQQVLDTILTPVPTDSLPQDPFTKIELGLAHASELFRYYGAQIEAAGGRDYEHSMNLLTEWYQSITNELELDFIHTLDALRLDARDEAELAGIDEEVDVEALDMFEFAEHWRSALKNEVLAEEENIRRAGEEVERKLNGLAWWYCGEMDVIEERFRGEPRVSSLPHLILRITLPPSQPTSQLAN
ncbi:hypothetical protein B0J14DRAFT_563458 [Halenospora varia]|nr:hypothetical protein B0J14DRAFT_563458 [Halenospora varia]